jgi:hypothetical protein
MEWQAIKSAVATPFRRAYSRKVAAEISVVQSSGLFDVSYYLLNGSDVAKAKVDPIEHFCTFGWREGRRPNHFFDPHWYCERYLGGLGVASNPLVHFIEQGERTGFRPINFVDTIWYRAEYAIATSESCLTHYLANRRSQSVAPNSFFDVEFYMDKHCHEIGRNRDPFMHLVRHGAAMKDFNPSSEFDSARYRREVLAFDLTIRTGLISHEMRVPLVHYLDRLIPFEHL